MKALILAAGYGKRLQPITNTIPKSMVNVQGTPLLVRTLDYLSELGISEIGIVVGHMADYIKEHIGSQWKNIPISYFENSRYLETNNVYSLYKAVDFCNEDMIMLECDLCYRKEVLSRLLDGKGDCAILVSPFNPRTMDGTVVRVEKDKVKDLIIGKWQGEGFDYTNTKKTVNMYKFSSDFARIYLQSVEWYVKNVGTQSYYEKILGSIIYLKEYDIRIVEIPEDLWCEIDNAEDLKLAEEKFKE